MLVLITSNLKFDCEKKILYFTRTGNEEKYMLINSTNLQ